MFGWHGKILRINLTNEQSTVETINPQTARDFIGGRGWAIKYLYDEVDPSVDPLAPENKLIFATGPLTGTPAPTGNRYMVVTKAPLTGAVACSNSGGVYPTEMKRTGFDMFIFEGQAERPVYVGSTTARWRSARPSTCGARRSPRPRTRFWKRPIPRPGWLASARPASDWSRWRVL